MRPIDNTAAISADPSTHPTPTPRFDFVKFAKESGACTLVPEGGSLRTAQSLDKLLAEVEEAWDEPPPSRSGTRLARSAVLEIDLSVAPQDLSHRERFVMMHVDGTSSVASLVDLLETVGIDCESTLEMLNALFQRGCVHPKKTSSGIRVNAP
jgi:hypothetical protein